MNRDLADFESRVVGLRSRHAAEHGIFTRPFFPRNVFSGRSLFDKFVDLDVLPKPSPAFDDKLSRPIHKKEFSENIIEKDYPKDLIGHSPRLEDYGRSRRGSLGERIDLDEEWASRIALMGLRSVLNGPKVTVEEEAEGHLGKNWDGYLAMALAEAYQAGKEINLADATIKAINVRVIDTDLNPHPVVGIE